MTKEQQGLALGLAKHFKVKKEKVQLYVKGLLQEAGESPLLSVDVSHIYDIHTTINVACTKQTLPLGKLLIYSLFKRSQLYSEVSDFFNNTETEIVLFYTGGCLMAITVCEAYDGSGGVFIKEYAQKKEGYAIEPFANYLEREFPVIYDN
jgi:hypothetical protein